MKKVEIVQLVFIILGISILFSVFIKIIDQISMFIQFSNNTTPELIWIIVLVAMFILVLYIGYLLISKSKYFASKIVHDENEIVSNISLNKSDIIHLSVVILCLFFLVQLFPPFFSSLYTIAYGFFNDFAYFKDTYPDLIWSIGVYIFILEVLIYSNKFSIWLENKVIK